MAGVGTLQEFLTLVVDTSTDSTTVRTGAGIVRGVFINTILSAHTVVIKDDTTAMFTLAASTPAGSWIPFGDAQFSTSLVVDPHNSSTGSITVVYKEVL